MQAIISLSLQMVVATFCAMNSLRVLPLVENAIILNVVPILVVMFSWFVIHERIDFVDILCITLSFSGVMLLIFLKDSTDQGTQNSSSISHEMGIFMISITAILMAYSCIRFRTMKDVSSLVPSFYIAIGSLLIYFIAAVILGESFEVLLKFTFSEHLLIMISGFAGALQFIFSHRSFAL
jgi:drug/metabolite transporter (DMT)-like permease